MLKLSLLSPKLLPTAHVAQKTVSAPVKRRNAKLEVTLIYQDSSYALGLNLSGLNIVNYQVTF